MQLKYTSGWHSRIVQRWLTISNNDDPFTSPRRNVEEPHAKANCNEAAQQRDKTQCKGYTWEEQTRELDGGHGAIRGVQSFKPIIT